MKKGGGRRRRSRKRRGTNSRRWRRGKSRTRSRNDQTKTKIFGTQKKNKRLLLVSHKLIATDGITSHATCVNKKSNATLTEKEIKKQKAIRTASTIPRSTPADMHIHPIQTV